MTNTIVRVYNAGRYQPAYTQMKPTKQRRRIKKRRTALYRMVQVAKRVKWGNVTVAVLATVGAVHIASTAHGALTAPDFPAAVPQAEVITAPAVPSAQNSATEQPTLPVEYIFRDGDGAPVDLEDMTSSWAAVYGTDVRYTLTDAERYEIASVVTAETTGEPFAGMMAVAQCILQSCEDDGIRPIKAIKKYSYSPNRPEPSADALRAVQEVFDLGRVAVDEPIKFFYAPALVNSEWHETQDYVMTINGHKFFKEAK